MRFNLKRAVGVMAIPLLGSALAVGATALPAHAATWQDTGLSAHAVIADNFGASDLYASDGTGDINLSATGTVTWSLHGTWPTGVTLAGTTISYSGATSTTSNIVVDATDTNGSAEALEIPVTLTSGTPGSIQLNGGTGAVVTDFGSALADANTAGTVTFSATSTAGGFSFAESSLPSGLVSGNPVLTYAGGTAAAGTYGGVKVAATDTDGAVVKGTFILTVYASGGATAGTYGDEVNSYGNGFDVYKQHDYPGAVIAGWTATQADPATHFLLLNGTHSGAVKIEYAPHGAGTGLCVSDPAGGWKADPLRDGLILTWCNNGAWQQFVPQSNHTLKNLATGLIVNPAGKGAQLRGGTTVTSWGGSVYAWKDYANLPA